MSVLCPKAQSDSNLSQLWLLWYNPDYLVWPRVQDLCVDLDGW